MSLQLAGSTFLVGEPIPNIAQLSVEVEGVLSLLTNIDPHKATGPDNIPPRLLRETAYQMAPLLSFIFQSSLDQVANWKLANITPLLKLGRGNQSSSVIQTGCLIY